MMCRLSPGETENLLCVICASPWYALRLLPNHTSFLAWDYLDFFPVAFHGQAAVPTRTASSDGLLAAVRATQADESLSGKEEARKREELMTGNAAVAWISDPPANHGERRKMRGRRGRVGGKSGRNPSRGRALTVLPLVV